MLRFLFGALTFLLLVSSAQAQLDLPKAGGRKPSATKPADRPKGGARPRGNTAPFMECTVCYERNYTTPFDPAAKNGMQKAWCVVCQTPRLHKHSGAASGGVGLDLPSPGARRPGSTGGGDARGAGAEPGTAPAPAEAPAPVAAGGVDLGLLRAGQSILDRISQVKRMDSSEVLHAPDELLALGQGGLAPARMALASDHGPTMIVALRTLLRGGEGEDADQVVQRIKARMPNRVAGAALDELVARDPVRASPELLCRLLAHPQVPVRSAAARALEQKTGGPQPEWLELLRPALDASSGDARLRALEFVAQIEGAAALETLIDHMDDPRGKVVAFVARALARSESEEVTPALMSAAFGDGWVLRTNACAVLALIEREDRNVEPILTGDHTEALLRGMDSSDPFVAGVSAAALSGIGFRTRAERVPQWMRTGVPAELVSVVAGLQFFEDHEAIQPIAQRRLQQISGQSLGADGPAWAQWWVERGAAFQPARAILDVGPQDAARVRVSWADAATGVSFELLGDGLLAASTANAAASETLYLDAGQSTELFLRLQEEGVFGATRLPGPRGNRVGRGRSLEVSIDSASKSFRYGTGAGDAWFERLADTLSSLRTRNRWQRYPHPERHRNQVQLVRDAGPWWAQARGEKERARALADLVLDWLAAAELEERQGGLEELLSLYSDPKLNVASEGDFGRLVARLREEKFFADRAERLVDLALISVGLGEEEAPVPATSAELALGHELIATLYERFEVDGAGAIRRVLKRLGHAAVLEAAEDSRPLLRGLAAEILADDPRGDDVAALEKLLDDANPGVEVQAVAAAGAGGVTALLPKLILRAERGEPDVRRAALQSIGKLGGVDAREVLLTTLTESGGAFRTEAALGLAELGDPRVASVLVGLLREGRNSDTWLAARTGLLDLGVAAHDELYSALRSADDDVRREAALLLARQMVPAAGSALLRLVTEDPGDQLALGELTILSCVDFRASSNPARDWWRWWDGVTHDEALPWFLAAAEIRSLPAPQPVEEHFGAELSRDAWLFLAEVLRRPEPWLAERARREIEHRGAGRIGEIGELPADPEEREAWIQDLVNRLLEGGGK